MKYTFSSCGLLLAMALASTVCAQKSPTAPKNPHSILVFGHGGSGFQSVKNPRPTNSFRSIRYALEDLKLDGIEVDVQLSADKSLVLYHDSKLNTLTHCNGCIEGSNATYITSCRYLTILRNGSLSADSVMLLEKFLQWHSGSHKNQLIFLDLKTGNECDPKHQHTLSVFAEAVTRMVNKYNNNNLLIVNSGSVELLQLLKKKKIRARLYLGGKADAIAIIESNGFDGLFADNNDITAGDVKIAHMKKIQVVLFKVKTHSGTKQAIEKGPDAIVSDNPKLLQQLLGR